MVKNYVMIVDVLKLSQRRKIILASRHSAHFLPSDKGGRPQPEIADVVSQRVLDPGAIATDIVKRHVEGNKPKLSFVDIVPVDPEKTVRAPLEMRCELMSITDVPGIVRLGIECGADGQIRASAGAI